MLDLIFVGQDAAQSYDNLLTLTLEKEEASLMVAPAVVWFECTAVAGGQTLQKEPTDTYDPEYHEIIYFWTFEDAANATPTTALNMPDIWKDTNTAYGRRVAHTFQGADTFTVTCFAYEPATRRFGSRTIDVEVANPDTYFPGQRTIVYAPGGISGATIPANANVQATWDAVVASREVFGSNQTARILLAPGVDLVFDDAQQINADRWSNARIGALSPDHPNRPTIRAINQAGGGISRCILRDNDSRCNEIILYGIDFVGEWDAATEKGKQSRPFFINSGSHTAATKALLVHRCSFDGFDTCTGIARNAAGTETYQMWSDTRVTNWKNYAILTGFFQGISTNELQGHIAIVGCSLAQNVDALSGGPKSEIHNAHGAIRDYGSKHTFISVCDLFSRNGWSGGGTFNGLSVFADQGVIRLNTTGFAGASAYVERIAAEGNIGMQEQNSTNVDQPGNYVFDKVFQVAGSMHYQASLLTADFGGTTIRNLLSIKLNLPEAMDANSNRMRDFIRSENEDGSPANEDARMAVYGSTFVDLRTDTQARGEDVQIISPDAAVPFSNSVYENNTLYQPNRTGVSNPTANYLNLSTFVAGFTPRHKGPRYNFMPERGVLDADVASSGGTLALPYSAITDQTVNLGYTDAGTPTNQAYWLANAGTDTRHEFYSRTTGTIYYAEDGDFTVTFEPSAVLITNTSGTTWQAGESWALHLDRSARLPAFDPQYDSTVQQLGISIPRPVSQGGEKAYDTLLLKERAAAGHLQGAL